jgi:hypothetical protein
VEFASALRASTIEDCEESIKNRLELLAQALHFYPARIGRSTSVVRTTEYVAIDNPQIVLSATYFLLTPARKSGERPQAL